MCRYCGETVDHLLLHCEMAYRLWSFVFITFGLSWVISRSIPDLLFGWWNWLGKHSSQIWNLVALCILWGLLRNWITPVISCLLLLVELFFIGLGYGDSRLVIPSLLFFAPFLFCNFPLFSFLLCFSLFSFSCIFSVCSMLFMHRVAFRIYIILTYQKKKKVLNYWLSNYLHCAAKLLFIKFSPNTIIIWKRWIRKPT